MCSWEEVSFSHALVCVQCEHPGTASMHPLLHLQTMQVLLRLPATRGLGKATAKGILTKWACWVISTLLSTAYRFVHSSFKIEEMWYFLRARFCFKLSVCFFTASVVFHINFLPVIKLQDWECYDRKLSSPCRAVEASTVSKVWCVLPLWWEGKQNYAV